MLFTLPSYSHCFLFVLSLDDTAQLMLSGCYAISTSKNIFVLVFVKSWEHLFGYTMVSLSVVAVEVAVEKRTMKKNTRSKKQDDMKTIRTKNHTIKGDYNWYDTLAWLADFLNSSFSLVLWQKFSPTKTWLHQCELMICHAPVMTTARNLCC